MTDPTNVTTKSHTAVVIFAKLHAANTILATGIILANVVLFAPMLFILHQAFTVFSVGHVTNTQHKQMG